MNDLRPSSRVVIDDSNFLEHLPEQHGQVSGLIPRDYSRTPVGSLPNAPPLEIPTIPRNEWKSRLRDKQQSGSTLRAVRDTGGYGMRMPSLDQGSKGFCWAHSTVNAVRMVRAIGNQPYVSLSAYSVACPVKNFRDEGGYCGESLAYIAEKGVASQNYWPQQSMDRKNLTPEMYANAALHRVTEWADPDTRSQQWVDLFVTLLLLGLPVVSDFNWWGHSVLTLDLVQIDPADIWGSIQTDIWNSWGDSWSDAGIGRISGRKCLPDGAVVPLVTKGSLT